jgi:penicillin V acylase-like amidase (Ntn superfamily)
MRINILGAHLLLSAKAFFKKKAVFMLTAAYISILSLNTNACTTFYLRNGDHFVVGRNFDLSYDKYLIFANRRHVTKTAIQYPGQSFSLPAIWTSKYGSVTFNMVGSDVPTDGMNETGLLVSSMILSSSVYPDAEGSPSILTEQLLQYFLDNCSTIDEVIDVCSNLEIHTNFYTPWNLHYLVVDNSGNCAVIEFIEGNITVIRGDDLEKKVLANSTYSLSMEYFNAGRNPVLPLTASLNRFYTAVEMTDAYAGEDIVNYSYSIMDAVEQAFTQRKIVYDIPNLRIYFKTLDNTQLRYFDLNTFDFSCQEETEIYNESLTDIGNIRDLFVPLTFELNKTAVQSGWNYMHLTYTEEELDAYSQLAMNYEPVFANAGEDISTCEDFFEVSGNTATHYTGSWSVESGHATFDNAAAITTKARNLGIGENRIRWTLSGDLGTFYDEIILTSNKVTANVGEDVSVCENQYTLTGNQPGSGESGQWEVISGSGNIQFATAPNSLITDLSKGTTEVRWSVSNNDCESSDILKITNNSVEANGGTDVIICGTEVQLEAVDPTPNTGSWKVINGGSRLKDPTQNNTVAENLEIGENGFEWTVIGQTGCSATDIVVVTNDLVPADAGEDQTVTDNFAYLFANEPIAGTGTWSLLEGGATFSDENSYNSQAQNLEEGINKFIWEIINNNCSDSDTVNITYSITSSVSQIDKGSPIKVFPNPFSEVLNIDMTVIKGNNAQLNIFNSRGQLVYSKLLSAVSNQSTMQVSLGNLPRGNYILTFISKEIVTKKILLKL